MAFYINPSWIRKYMLKQKEKVLFLKRNDKELNKNINYQIDTNMPVDVRDWPSIDKDNLPVTIRFLMKLLEKKKVPNKLMDIVFSLFLRPYMVKMGARFLSAYTEIYTTRLHVCILSVLLGKTCILFDNSYGKNKFFYETWLKNLNNCRFL